ncbi:sarcosine oxidase subunit gamma family protein [Albimonas sp. CAU 1670]|uniref:sarcosine oxidase subunit gamma n=1 Tax=Albimonas sp. CAU 1670 TaxID=3032599 RepID=UPI0023DA2F1E|nr:sarcosine oxidase subunit gamma family protein [Albimonas sp. CAU 1670]MDF2234054.1 sarcosine oxidase subunit gamma family protein [Albimonas sp. CAU 1670]
MSDPAVAWSRVRDRGMIGIRADLSVGVARKALQKACGVPVPEVRKLSLKDGRALAWMSPDELMLMLPKAEVPAALSALAEGLEGRHHLAVDLSDARAVFRLEGPGAREVLAKGAPVDLSRAAFGPGDFRRTRLGQLAAAFGQVSDEPEAFEMVCFRSVSAHVERWLDLSTASGSLPAVF